MLSLPELIQQAAAQVRRIDAATAYTESVGIECWFIDVREPAEAAEQPITGSVNFPRGIVEMKVLEHCKAPDTPIYIHCATSARATLAAEQLQRLGYTRVSAISCQLETIRSAQKVAQ